MTHPAQNAIGTFNLPTAITVANVEILSAQLKELSQHNHLVVLDAAATDVVTTPGAQLFLALHQSLTTRGGALTVVNASDKLSQHFEQLGLKNHFSVWRSPAVTAAFESLRQACQ